MTNIRSCCKVFVFSGLEPLAVLAFTMFDLVLFSATWCNTIATRSCPLQPDLFTAVACSCPFQTLRWSVDLSCGKCSFASKNASTFATLAIKEVYSHHTNPVDKRHAKILLKLTTKVTGGYRPPNLYLNVACPLFIHETLSWWRH